MLIDWFTVVAQIVNFLVLVALMKHFLYGPLVAAIDAREKRIAARLAEAEKKNQEADAPVSSRCALEAEQLAREREQMLAEARQEADRQRDEMLEKARESVRALEAKWREDLDAKKPRSSTKFGGAPRPRFWRSRGARWRISPAPTSSSAPSRLFSKSFRRSIPPALRDDVVLLQRIGSSAGDAASDRRERCSIASAIARAAADSNALRTMAWGMELRGNGQRIGWTPDSYLDSLEENLRKALDSSGRHRVTR